MQDGDEILVPRISEVVYVVGDVLQPGNYRHVEGTTAEQYINLAAGIASPLGKRMYTLLCPMDACRG